MIYQLPELPYAYDALEPGITAETMKLHHDQHHKGYVTKLNKVLEPYPKLQDLSIEELLSDLSLVPEMIRAEVRNHGGGHYNHSFLWKILSPAGVRTPCGHFKEKLEQTFGTFASFKKEFSTRATSLFGSGYVWLCVDLYERLHIKSLPNQDCPLMYGAKPLFLMDLWEHAYYLQHQNRRDEYIGVFWELTDWAEVARRWDAHQDAIRKTENFGRKAS